MEFELLDQVKDIATEAGRAILNIYQQDDVGIQTKRDQSPLTQADLASHDIITKALKQLTPDIPILSEEGHTLGRRGGYLLVCGSLGWHQGVH
jgi:3'(2'), 5'-bisphosphate nucleotidase